VRRKAPRVGFSDMPKRLVEARDDQAKRERLDWLEAHGLALVDFLSWKRSQDPLAKLGPPSRRKFMPAEQLTELDARREREGDFECFEKATG
jgi:hypothetical protein